MKRREEGRTNRKWAGGRKEGRKKGSRERESGKERGRKDEWKVDRR